jgi:hypothetical protein
LAVGDCVGADVRLIVGVILGLLLRTNDGVSVSSTGGAELGLDDIDGSAVGAIVAFA